jgi:hypothetical protein
MASGGGFYSAQRLFLLYWKSLTVVCGPVEPAPELRPFCPLAYYPRMMDFSSCRFTILRSAAAIAAVALAALTAPASLLSAMEQVSIQRDGQRHHVSGKVLVEAQDGGVLLLADDGVLWAIQPDEITDRRSGDRPYEPLSPSQLGERLLKELPDGFQIHTTSNYVIAYNTSSIYAQWCGSLFERLYRGFFTFWRHRGMRLEEPDRPLVAIVFRDYQSYAQQARKQLGEATDSVLGYYDIQSNRVMMYDLTGVDGLLPPGVRIRSATHLNNILSQPAAERTVATIVHEATHQLAYNSGLQTRLADNPFWVSEGLAIYFETPDLNSTGGWRSIGGVNYVNLARFREYLPQRPADSLLTLIADDRRFRDPQQVRHSYAEAWALTFFLMRTQRREFSNYMRTVGSREPLEEVTPAQRVAEFQDAFGEDIEQLDRDFLRFMSRVR